MRGMRLVAQRVQKQDVEVRAASPAFRAELRCDRSDKRPIRSGSQESASRRESPSTARSAPRKARPGLQSDAVDQRQSAKFICRPQKCSETYCAEIRSLAAWHKAATSPACGDKSAAAGRRCQDMVGVGVRVEHGVELRDVFAQRLLAKVGRAVDHDVRAVVRIADHHGGASAAVVRVRTNGKRRSRNRWLERPSMCRCLIPSESPASAVGTCNRARRLRRTRERVGHFHVRHAQFIEAVLQESLLFRSEIALGFFRDHTQRVDGLPRADDVDSRAGRPARASGQAASWQSCRAKP
jgi:hypothetical protein